jgi:predicted RND superfamily exporter protein
MTTGRLTRIFYLLLGRPRLPVLLTLALLTILLARPALEVGIEQDNASMAAAEPTQVALYQDFQRLFGRDDVLLLGLQSPNLLSRSGLERLDRLTREIEALPGIDRVFSLSNARIAVPGPFGAEAANLLPDLDNDDFAALLTTHLQQHPTQTRRLLSADRQTAALLAIPTVMDGIELQQLVLTLRKLGQQLPAGNRLYLTGLQVQKADVARAIQRDQRTIIPLSVTILGLLLLLLFRRPLGVLLPLAVMGISLTWTIGLYSLAGLQLNTVTALLPPVIMVLAVATSVHLLHGWLELAGEKGEVRTLLAHCMATLFVPCLLTALTTAIGLLSLSVCEIPAVRYFGLFAGLGTLIAFAVAVLLIPILLSWQPLPPRITGRQLRPLRHVLRRLTRLILWRPGMILVAATLLSSLALPGLWQIRNNTDLVRFFRPSSPLHADTLALDRNLGGVESLEMVLSRQDGLPLDAALLHRLAGWQKQLQRHPEVTGSFGLPDLLGTLWRADRPESTSELPENDAELLEIFDLLTGVGDRKLVEQLVSSDLRHARLSVQLHLLGSASASRLGELLLAEGRQQLGPDAKLQATGDFLLMSGDSNRLVVSLLKSFGLSLSLVLIALYATFRNWRLLLVALAPNLIPLLWTGGLMGWFDIDLNTGTAMIAAVTIGLVVDDTIHFLHRYQREHRGYIKPALVRTTLGVGPALITSTLVLTLGFWVGIFGSFLPTAWFSLLTGATLIGALVCDLLVLPAGLLVLGRLRNRALAPVLILAFLLFPSPQAKATTLPGMLQESGEDLPVRSAPIPVQPPHVGELKLLKRGTAVVLQTDLETTLLRRVLAAISAKEQQRWPAESAGHAAMLDYLRLLRDAGTAAEARVADKPVGSDRKRRLQIEFIAAPPVFYVAFFLPEEAGRKLFSNQRISRDFCLTEIGAILGEHLQLDTEATAAILHPLLPPGSFEKEKR